MAPLKERSTSRIADTIVEVLQPKGVAVVIQAEHLGMTMRGAKKPGSNIKSQVPATSFRLAISLHDTPVS